MKNIVRIGVALASSVGKKLVYKHLETAVMANKEFELDFRGVGKVESLNSYA
jgi:hypothetical protein